jgi:MFS family permease
VKVNTSTKKKRTAISQAKFGAILTLIALAFGSAPAIVGSTIGVITSTPGDGGGWGLIVFMLTLITGPIGAVVALIGLVSLLTGFVRVIRTQLPAEGDAKREEVLGERAIAFALLSIPLLIVQTVVNFVMGHMNIGQGILVPIVVTTGLVVTASVVAIRYGAQSQQQKLRRYVSVASWFSMLLAVGLGVFWYLTFTVFHNA